MKQSKIIELVEAGQCPQCGVRLDENAYCDNCYNIWLAGISPKK